MIGAGTLPFGSGSLGVSPRFATAAPGRAVSRGPMGGPPGPGGGGPPATVPADEIGLTEQTVAAWPSNPWLPARAPRAAPPARSSCSACLCLLALLAVGGLIFR